MSATAHFGMAALPVLLSRDTYRDRYINCTIETCNLDTSYYYYRMNLGANAAFVALFSLSLVGFIATYAFTRRGWAFTFAMTAGVALEIVGYAGRIMSWQNQWKEPGFLVSPAH